MAAVFNFALRNGDVEVVRLLLQAGARTNTLGEHNWTALTSATFHGAFEVVGLLLDAGADPNLRTERGLAPLTLAASGRSVEAVKLLLEAGAQPNVDDPRTQSPLVWPARLGRADIVEVLLQGGVDPNRADPDGVTPLMLAARCESARKTSPQVNYPATVRLLLQHGARLEPKDRHGRTARDYAQERPSNGRHLSDPEIARLEILEILPLPKQ